MGYDDKISNLKTVFEMAKRYIKESDANAFMNTKFEELSDKTPTETILNNPDGFFLVKDLIESKNYKLKIK